MPTWIATPVPSPPVRTQQRKEQNRLRSCVFAGISKRLAIDPEPKPFSEITNLSCMCTHIPIPQYHPHSHSRLAVADISYLGVHALGSHLFCARYSRTGHWVGCSSRSLNFKSLDLTDDDALPIKGTRWVFLRLVLALSS